MMKKILKTVLILLLCICATVCINVQKTSAASNNTKAKKYLKTATKDCKIVMDTIYSSWEFQVNSDDYAAKALVDFYAENTGIPKSKVKSIIKKISGETDWAGQAAAIQVLSYNLEIVDKYYTQKGTFKKIKNNLGKAKKLIKKMPRGSKRNKFIKYYNAVNKYYKFVKSPTGNFAGLSDKMDELNENVDDAKEAVSW